MIDNRWLGEKMCCQLERTFFWKFSSIDFQFSTHLHLINGKGFLCLIKIAYCVVFYMKEEFMFVMRRRAHEFCHVLRLRSQTWKHQWQWKSKNRKKLQRDMLHSSSPRVHPSIRLSFITIILWLWITLVEGHIKTSPPTLKNRELQWNFVLNWNRKKDFLSLALIERLNID